jgi:uncharacterized protein YdhG (YjbR/CyaY superfamily)
MAARPRFDSVDAYIAAAAPAAQEPLRALRAAVRAAVPEASECISYQMPALRLPAPRSRVFFYFAAFKQHIGVYPPVHEPALVEALARWRGPKGNLQFPLNEPLPLDVLAQVATCLARPYSAAP